jgi:hypothetical protein
MVANRWGASSFSHAYFGESFRWQLKTPNACPPNCFISEKQGTSVSPSPIKIMFANGMRRSSWFTFSFTA